jgi:S1-C subfamily serine protease
MLRWSIVAVSLFAVACGGVQSSTEHGSNDNLSAMMNEVAASSSQIRRQIVPRGSTSPILKQTVTDRYPSSPPISSSETGNFKETSSPKDIARQEISPAGALKKLEEATVRITTSRGNGTGLIFDNRGYVLTADHVVRSEPKVTVTHADGREEVGFVLGRDEVRDIAVVKISGSPELAVASLGGHQEVQIGDPVLSYGYTPFNEGMSSTSGVISAIIPYDVEGYQFIQTDAFLYPGQSGGPLLNLEGDVIGLLSKTLRVSELGVFLPVQAGWAVALDKQTLEILPKLQAGHVFRNPIRPSLGHSNVNPAPVGWPVRVSGRLLGGTDSTIHEIHVETVIRGDQAFQMLKDVSQWNAEPNESMEYVLALVRVRYVKGPDSASDYVFHDNFRAMSGDGLSYRTPYFLSPMQPLLEALVFPGATIEGWTTWQVSVNDPEPLLVFGLDLAERGEAWFSLTSERNASTVDDESGEDTE